MSKEMPLILYVGDEGRGGRLQQMTAALGWTVLTATEERQALGMYVFYIPDLIIVDSHNNVEGAETVVFHLHSVQAQPMLMLTPPRGQMALPPEMEGQALPSAVEESRIVLAAAQLLQTDAVLC